MQRPRPTRTNSSIVAVASASMAVVVSLAGCGVIGLGEGDDKASASARPSALPHIDCAKKAQVAGSGSSAQQNVMKYWMKQYQQACPGVQLAYNPLGSGAGAAQFLRGATAFGGSDSALKPSEAHKAPGVCPGGRVINLPMVGGPIAIGYNLPGVDDLVLDAPTLAKIFDSRISSWDDPEIQELNPGTELPSIPVRPLHRSDDSGTTQNLQAYLAGAAPEVWPYEAEKSWQGRGGGSASGTSGVASEVNSAFGTIGYVELSFAESKDIRTVRIDTGAAEPVAPTPETASAGIAAAQVIGKGKDLTLKFRHDLSADGAYPISLVTYELVCDKGNQPATLPALKSFLTYTAGDEGQRLLSEIHYAPLPKSVAVQVRQVVRELS
ncbi:phosphate ABC transporter substrate-binding protein PstS [Streptomyces sp. NBC_01381]|uniref:phosphate ABC transporter substrate-binding protein PstS n=1 Tax=Streptomyces sp. NBC_01381 TaxID=2903845 RepID=UPI00225160D8|nr:phosphate ABC transporter substrate-binding protein PstS [Streptomyces sp. NBC_01381]MCX4669164.1 phosphate ABC transporter substrate-binding protein PstS [Streptomyces sp. NBC_01381]